MKILAIASAGGHWIQLLRLVPSFENNEVVFISTNPSFAETISKNKFFHVPDASRRSKLKLIVMGFCVAKIVFSQKPNIIVTTGAAPGLMGIIFGRIFGCKTIWIDSIANVEKISLSGRIALLFADKVLTQWPHLASSKIEYKGNILS